MVGITLRLKFLEALVLFLIAAMISASHRGIGDLFLVTIAPMASIVMLYLVYLYLPTQVGLAWLFRHNPRLLVLMLTATGVLHIFLVVYALFASDPELLSQATIFILAATPVLLAFNISIAGWAVIKRRAYSADEIRMSALGRLRAQATSPEADILPQSSEPTFRTSARG